jgi:HEAT repeat protein
MFLKQWIPFLNDPISDIHDNLLNALRIFVQRHGNPEFVQVIRNFSKHPSDSVRQSIVVLLGDCAAHLKEDDPQFSELCEILVASLRTPSEAVQLAVSQCLSSVGSKATYLFPSLLKSLFSESKYGVQRGFAYGLAGLIKSERRLLKEHNLAKEVANRLQQKDVSSRQGALLLLETCTILIGRMFEPWLIQNTPSILALFSDTNAEIRQTALEASKVMMKTISTHAIKLLLPSLMDGFRSDAWRTKKASIELLAAIAYCPPAQLSNSLPTVIPALLSALADSHHQVCNAAKDALNTFGEVVTTPEIQVLVPILLEALVAESKSLPALKALGATTFEHYLDPISIALTFPIVHTGLKGRIAEQKCSAAQILGNLVSLAPAKEQLHYIHDLLPSLLQVLSDAVPKTRSMAARTLGIFVRTLGDVNFPSLVTELFHVLNTSTSTVDKSGAAQGLSEVLAAMGDDSLHTWMPTIIQGLQSSWREGYLVLLVFLPTTFGAAYTQFIPLTLASVLDGLSDESELVRDSALRAAQVVIDMFNATAIDLLLPELLNGVFNSSWRIRYSSVQLLGA